RIAERREQFAGPEVIEAFMNAGQRLGFIPRGDFKIVWPESDTLGESGRADVALKKAQALQSYTSSIGADMIIPPQLFRQWLGESPDMTPDGEDLLPEEATGVIEQFNIHKKRRRV